MWDNACKICGGDLLKKKQFKTFSVWKKGIYRSSSKNKCYENGNLFIEEIKTPFFIKKGGGGKDLLR